MSLRDKVVEMKEELEEVRKISQENSLATEMLRELKAQNKRQHITIIILIGVIVAMAIGFFIYESKFETVSEQESTQETYFTENSEVTQNMN